jgi:hypothetical protein
VFFVLVDQLPFPLEITVNRVDRYFSIFKYGRTRPKRLIMQKRCLPTWMLGKGEIKEAEVVKIDFCT